MGWPLQHHEFDPVGDISELSVNQLLPGTSDGFPEIVSQELRAWSEGYQAKGRLEVSRCHPLPFSDHPESYCDPPHEEIYSADPPHEAVYGADLHH